MKEDLKLNELNELVENYWEDHINAKCVYRGMDRNDLIFPFNPKLRPFETVSNLINSFFSTLNKLMQNGILFDIVETHFGISYKHSLQNIVSWSIRDISTIGIDFTSNYQAALEYADCWQGSQLKQNVKTISEYLISNRTRLKLSSILSEIELADIDKAKNWVNSRRNSKPIIIHLKRSFNGFKESDKFLPLGTKEQFKTKMQKYLTSLEYIEVNNIISLLSKEVDEFCCSIIKPIDMADILHIEEISKI